MCKTVLAVLLLILVPVSISAFEFQISPQANGSVDALVSLDWRYGRTNLFSGLGGSMTTAVFDSENISSYVASTSRILSAQADLLGIRESRSIFGYSLALNGRYDRLLLREIGYTDGSGTQYFVLNDRTMNRWFPRLHGEGHINLGSLRLGAGGEYSPWYYLTILQELTISPGLPKRENNSVQSGFNAFSINGEISLNTDPLSISLSGIYDNVTLKYSALTASGTIPMDTLNEVISIKGEIAFTTIRINGLNPTIFTQYQTASVTDRIAQSRIVSDGTWSFGIGMK